MRYAVCGMSNTLEFDSDVNPRAGEVVYHRQQLKGLTTNEQHDALYVLSPIS